MYCLNKLQEILAEFLELNRNLLPSIEENLKKAGYIGIQKGEEIEYFSQGLAEFGTNYPEFYHNGKGAIAKLLETKQGQVAGAFYKEGLGDIDLVWGEVFTNKKDEIDGFGLSKILEKHAKNGEFRDFGGDSIEAQMQNALIEIINKGKVIDENGRVSIVLNYNDKVYRLGLKGNWKGETTKNKWIIYSL